MNNTFAHAPTSPQDNLSRRRTSGLQPSEPGDRHPAARYQGLTAQRQVWIVRLLQLMLRH